MDLRKIIITIVTVSLIFIFSIPKDLEIKEKERENTTEKTNIKIKIPSTYTNKTPLSFSVIGDVHSNALKLMTAIKDLYKVNPKTDAIILNGDTVDQGLDNHYSRIAMCLEQNKALLPRLVIKNIGNHEFFDYSKGPNGPIKIKYYIGKYLTFSNYKNVYHDIWIKDYHFISLGSEECNTKKIGNTNAYISRNQQNWLKEKLAENYIPGKPIFVFLHQHIAKNEINTSLESSNVIQHNEIKVILSKYPEAILFTSHTHNLLKPSSLVYLSKPFLTIHTGAVNNPVSYYSKGKDIITQKSQGLYIEIINNKLIIRGREFEKGDWIDGVLYTRDLL